MVQSTGEDHASIRYRNQNQICDPKSGDEWFFDPIKQSATFTVGETSLKYLVLIVDDDDKNLQFLGNTIQTAGYQVILARDGISALKIIKSKKPDAILIDIMTPNIDGLKICQIMKENPVLKEIPVIFLLSAEEEKKIEEGLESGGVDFVLKPFNNRILLARLRSHIERGMLQKRLNQMNTPQQVRSLYLKGDETYLHSVFKGIPIPLFVINRDHQVISWNRAMENFSGIMSSDIIGTDRHWSAFYQYPRPCLSDLLLDGAPGDLDLYYPGTIRSSPLDKTTYEVTELFPGINNSVWLFFTASPVFNREGLVIGAVETVIDISEQKKGEESLKKIIQKLHLLSDITRHDILNKITCLNGFVTLVRDQIPDPETIGYFERIRDNVEVIRNQITFTRDYQEIGIHLPEWQNLEEVFTKAADGLDISQVEIVCHTDEFELYADPLIERVFYNLLENSIRHGKNLTIIRLNVQYQENTACIVYEDDGGGIPDSEKENIFQRRYYSNSGYGLFLSREVVQITGFTITEKGKEGIGVRFEIIVPQGYYRSHPAAYYNIL